MRRLYRRVVIESPFGGATPEAQEENLRYLRACMRDALDRGEAPFASHGLYTQPGVLNDWDPQEREKGILAGFEWRLVAQATIVYADRGITPGMRAGIRKATELQQGGVFDHYVEYRFLGGEWSALGGPEEIKKHLDRLLDDPDHKHRHLALVTGPHPSPRQMHVMPTPAELSMAHVAVVKKVESPTGPSGSEEQPLDEVPLATKPFERLEAPNGPISESYRRARASVEHAKPSFAGEFGGEGFDTSDTPGRMGDGKIDKPMTLDEVKDALKKGGDARKEAEKTIKRPPRH